MDGQREPAKRFGLRVVGWRSFEASFRPLEAQAQGKCFVHIADLPQQSTDLIGAPMRVANDPKRGRNAGFAGLNGLEQSALELPATHGPVGVDAATAAVERGTRLGKF